MPVKILPNKLETIKVRSPITAVWYFSKEDAIITINEDQTIKIWLKRLNGEFWPSVSHPLKTNARTLICYSSANGKYIVVGMSDGGIEEFIINSDFNSIQSCDYYLDHSMTVTNLYIENSFIFALSEDGTMSCRFPSRTTVTNSSLSSVGKSIYVDPSKIIIVGTSSGIIDVFSCDLNFFDSSVPVNRLEGHKGQVTSLCWSREYDYLVSGDSKGEIMLWDFGGKSGVYLNMTFHTSKIMLTRILCKSSYLLSISTTGQAALWNMNYKRYKRGDMAKANYCSRCNFPFMWNFKMMVQNKVVGTRRHHCRNCLNSFCGNCCSNKIIIPKMGYESSVLVCNECFVILNNESNKPEIETIPLNVNPIVASYLTNDETVLLTACNDRTVAVWSLN